MRMLPTIMRSSNSVRALFLGALVLTAGASSAAAASGDIVLHARSATAKVGAWSLVSDTTAADGVRIANPDAGQPKVASAAASPANYFELTFTPEAGKAYHLWIRGKAQNNSYTNDSVFVQFSGSLNASGSAAYRIGTTSAMVYSLEEDSGMGEAGWGWQDNGYGLNVLGENIYFAATPQTIRVQVREDGLSIDQIVLSPVTYLTTAPGAAKNDTKILTEAATATTTTTTSSTTTGSTTGFGWTSLVKASAVGAKVTKTTGCGDCADAGAVGTQQMTSGSVSFTVSGGRLAAGLGTDTSSSTNYAAINYAFNFSTATNWDIREKGVYRAEGTYSTSDVFKIAIEGTAIKYYRNGALVYTSATAVPGALVMDTTLVSIGAAVQVVDSSATTTAPAPAPAPAPTPTPTPTTGSTLKILQWNLHHGGYGTDGVYDTNRVATWMAKMNPDVIMVNEVEKFTSWGNQDQSEVYKALLQQKTGKTWYYTDAQEFGQWTSNGKRNVIFSTVPFETMTRYEVIHNADRSAAVGIITWNGRRITLVSTHLDPYDATLRLTQAHDVTGFLVAEPENKIMTGDMNAWPDQASIQYLNSYFYDSWTVAASKGTAYAFAGNTGETKNGRIDYIFYSKGSANVAVTSSQVFDTRDANGVMPSDHRPVMTTFQVQ
jgi:endonuclease/exonuclease/phosphatase family metal-dependent hydrolase